MNISRHKRVLLLSAYLGPVVLALSGLATRTAAQTSLNGSNAGAASKLRADSAAQDELRNRVATALHANPYFYDAHVTVSVEKGAVVLRGFVFSDWDLEEAIRIAGKAAGTARVIDNLSITQGGR